MKITELLNTQPTVVTVGSGSPARVVPHDHDGDIAMTDTSAMMMMTQNHDGTGRKTMDLASLDQFAKIHGVDAQSNTVIRRPMLSMTELLSQQVHGTTPTPTPAPSRHDTGPSSDEASPTHHSQQSINLKKPSAAGDQDHPPPQRRRRGRASGSTMTDAEKREKQRVLVKKSYYRKIDTLNLLRDTVSQLEKEYHEVAAERQRRQHISPKKEPIARHSISALITTESPEDEMRQSFADLALSVEELRRENENLRSIAMEQSKASTRVGILVQEELNDQRKRAAEYASLVQQIPTKWQSLDNAPSHESSASSPLLEMTPITSEECMEIARQAYTEIMAFQTSTNYVTTGGTVFGWRDRRKTDGELVKFALEKTFRNRTCDEVATNTWRVLSTERGVNRIYSSSIRATFHLVQQVDPHNVIFYRTMERVGTNILLKSLVLASFVQTENGYLLLFRSIDPQPRAIREVPALTRPEIKSIWVDMFSWGVFTPEGEHNEHCHDFFGGFVPCTVATSFTFWMMEVLLIAVRCESECVAPVISLQNGEDEHEEEGHDVQPLPMDSSLPVDRRITQDDT